MSHVIIKCSKCGIVIAQCRCMNPNKPVRYEVCDECKTNSMPITEHPDIQKLIIQYSQLQTKYDKLKASHDKRLRTCRNMLHLIEDLKATFKGLVRAGEDTFHLIEDLKASLKKLEGYARHTSECVNQRFDGRERWKCICGLNQALEEAGKI